MRLTLRTMLAWLDNVLEPADADILGKKINESDFANGLVQRIRTVTKKVRMDAPKLDGKGNGNDANAVAEYLDSTLPQDRVADFERVCLESDKHLAEVASCHQILTLVLGKAADVPIELRERLYGLAHPDAAAAEEDGVVPPPKQAGMNGVGVHGQPAIAAAAQPEVPDYLRAGQRTSPWKYLAAIAAALVFGLVVLRAMGPFDQRHPVVKMFGSGTPVADSDANGTGPSKSPFAPPAGTNDGSPAPAPPPTVPETPVTPKGADNGDALNVPPPPVEPPPVGPTVNTTPAVIPPAPIPAAVNDAAATTEKSATVAKAATDKPAIANPAAPPPMPVPPAAPDMPPAAVVMDVGRYVSDEQVLALFVPADEVWMRVPPTTVLASGDRLVSLPAFRPQIALASGVQVTFVGESSVELQPPGPTGTSRMQIDFGRLLFVTPAAGAQIELNLGGLSGVATLVDADSALAIQVKRYLPPGSDPEASPAVMAIEIFNTNGRVTWREADQEAVDIPSNHLRVYAGADPPETFGPFQSPEWISSKNISPIDRATAIVLEHTLEYEKPLNLSLLEMMGDRRPEVQSLSARCLAFLGEFEPIIKALGDNRQSAFWTAQFEALRHAVSRAPDTAAKLKFALERLRGEDAALLYRLMWGYSQEQLQKQSAAELVKLLEHDQMDVRVLTFQNLFQITGVQEFYYPHKPPNMNKGPILNWNDRLKKGGIAYKSPPSPFDSHKPLERPVGAADAGNPRGAVAPLEAPRP